MSFGEALPKIRARLATDLKAEGMPRNKVLATVVRLLEQTSVRVGNEEYRKQNDSFGLTTLRNRHVEVEGNQLRFRFKGKSGQMHDIKLTDRKLARIVGECQCLPGHELFEYLDDDGQPVPINSEDVNAYLREITGEDFTAKDFRTWNGTRQTAMVLETMGPAANGTELKKNLVEAVKRAAGQLGNRPATCRKYYVHPALVDAYTDGSLFEVMNHAQPREGLDRAEAVLMELLSRYQPEVVKAVA